MASMPQTLRYLPHTLDTRYHATKTSRAMLICRRYQISLTLTLGPNKEGFIENLPVQTQKSLQGLIP